MVVYYHIQKKLFAENQFFTLMFTHTFLPIYYFAFLQFGLYIFPESLSELLQLFFVLKVRY